MKDKILTVEEIKEFMDTYNSIEDFTERSKFVEKYPIKTANIIRERMTLPLMEATDETNKEDVWNFINKCSTFAHCPGSQGDYKRMLKFADNEALVDVVINTISKMGYPFSEEDRGDFVTYYYGIALISQSNYRREDTLKLLEELVDYVIENNSIDADPLVRNLKVLSKTFDDLKEIYEKSKPIYAMVSMQDILSEVTTMLCHVLPYNYITEEQVQAQYLNVENPIDGKVNVEINLDTFLLKIYDNGKVTFKLKTKDFRIVSYAIIRDVLFRKYLSEHNEGEINYQGISELVNKDIQRMYSKSCIEVYNETLKYIDDMNNNNCIG